MRFKSTLVVITGFIVSISVICAIRRQADVFDVTDGGVSVYPNPKNEVEIRKILIVFSENRRPDELAYDLTFRNDSEAILLFRSQDHGGEMHLIKTETKWIVAKKAWYL